MRLDPLAQDSADEMLTALVGPGAEVAPLKRLIIERTEGNPFFMEEMVLVLFDEGALVRNGAVKLTRALNQLRIPPTVQAMLAARIDRLPAEEKDLLQTLAVLGREFPLALIRSVAQKLEDVERMLSELQLVEFIYEQPAAGDVEYIFKHALTQEVAYGSILVERRKTLHERAGRALESLYSAKLEERLGELSHHYARSGNTEKAIEYFALAGEQAVQRSAYEEGVVLLTKALEALGTLPAPSTYAQRELALQTTLGHALTATKGWSDPCVGAAYTAPESSATR
jgi:predicted ATPase